MPANICPIVPITFFKAGVPFDFVDIDPESLHMDLEQVEDRLESGSYGGILYAHTYGDTATPEDAFRTFRSLHPGLLIVDDRCLCIPEFEVRSSAQVTLFSTGYSKVADLGFGGYAILQDPVGYAPRRLDFQRHHHDEVVRSYKEAIADTRRFTYRDSDWLETDAPVPEWSEYEQQIHDCLAQSLTQRTKLNEIYVSRLPAVVRLPAQYQTWRHNVRVQNKEDVLKGIFAAGLFASSHYAPLTGIMGRGSAPHAAQLANSVINLFNDHHFDADRAEHVCEIILAHI